MPWWALRLLMVVLSVVAFAPGLNSPLTPYDDEMYLTQNTQPGLAGFLSVFSAERAWGGKFVEFFPLRDAVYWGLYQGFGLTPWPYHVVGLLAHLVAALLVLEFMRKLTPRPWVAAAGALLFAVHPIHSESITWASGLKDPMYVSFMLGCLLTYLRFRQRPSVLSYLGALTFLVLALLCKSMALVVPGMWLLLERSVGSPTPWRIALARAVPAAVVCAWFLKRFIGISAAYHVERTIHGGTVFSHAVLAMWAQVVYLKQAVLPVSTRLVYCFVPPEALTDPRLWAAVALAAGLLALAYVWRRQPLRLFCLAWHFICLVPVSNLVPFPAVVADRYLYAASLGVCLLAADLLSSLQPLARTTILGLMVTALTLTTAFRSSVWNYPEELWAEGDEDPACMVDPDFQALQAHYTLYLASPHSERGVEAMRRTVACKAFQSRLADEACRYIIQLSQAEQHLHHDYEATQAARLATRTCPGMPEVWLNALQLTGHRNLPVAAMAAARLQALNRDALSLLWRGLTALEVEPGNPKALNDIGIAISTHEPDVCRVFADWRREVSPTLQAQTEGALNRCREAAPKP